jgi:uncharacterized BrkB/YihY/UPF0761 family membrane protein
MFVKPLVIQLGLVFMMIGIMTMILFILTVYATGQIIWVDKISYMCTTEGLESSPVHNSSKYRFITTMIIIVIVIIFIIIRETQRRRQTHIPNTQILKYSSRS